MNDDNAMLDDLLADPSVWAEPSGDLEDAVVRAVLEARPPDTARRRRRLGLATTGSIAAAVVAAVVIGIAALTGGGGAVTPDYEGALRPTPLAPGATATADVTRTDAGFRIVVNAQGLRRLGAGEYYEAWLKDATGTLVPVGTFSSSDNRVTFWSGVSPSRFSTMTVTIEPADDDAGSSGRLVLAGTLRAR